MHTFLKMLAHTICVLAFTHVIWDTNHHWYFIFQHTSGWVDKIGIAIVVATANFGLTNFMFWCMSDEEVKN
jgi:hypothetical protein